MYNFNVGDKVMVNANLKLTDEYHTVCRRMLDYRGMIFEIRKIYDDGGYGPSILFVLQDEYNNDFYWHPSWLTPTNHSNALKLFLGDD